MHGGGGLGALGGGLGLGGPGAAGGVGPAGGAGPKAPENQNLLQFLQDKHKLEFRNGKAYVIKTVTNNNGIDKQVKYSIESVQAKFDNLGPVVDRKDDSFVTKIQWKIGLKKVQDPLQYWAKDAEELTLEDNHVLGETIRSNLDRGASWQLMAYISAMKMPLITNDDQWRRDAVIKQLASNNFVLKRPVGDHKFVVSMTVKEEKFEYGVRREVKTEENLNIRAASFKVQEAANGFFEIQQTAIASPGLINLSKYVDKLSQRIISGTVGYDSSKADLISKHESLAPDASIEEMVGKAPIEDDYPNPIEFQEKVEEYHRLKGEYIEFLREGINSNNARIEHFGAFFSNEATVREHNKWVDNDKVGTVASWSGAKGVLKKAALGLALMTVLPAALYSLGGGNFSYNEFGRRARIGPKFSNDLENLQREKNKGVSDAVDNYKSYVSLIKENIGEIQMNLEDAGKKMLHLQTFHQGSGAAGFAEELIKEFIADRERVLVYLESKIKQVAKYLEPADRDAILGTDAIPGMIRVYSPVVTKMQKNVGNISDVIDPKTGAPFVRVVKSPAVAGISPPAVDPGKLGVVGASLNPAAAGGPSGPAPVMPPVIADQAEIEAKIRDFIDAILIPKGDKNEAWSPDEKTSFFLRLYDLVLDLKYPTPDLLDDFLAGFKKMQPFKLETPLEIDAAKGIINELNKPESHNTFGDHFVNETLALIGNKFISADPLIKVSLSPIPPDFLSSPGGLARSPAASPSITRSRAGGVPFSPPPPSPSIGSGPVGYSAVYNPEPALDFLFGLKLDDYKFENEKQKDDFLNLLLAFVKMPTNEEVKEEFQNVFNNNIGSFDNLLPEQFQKVIDINNIILEKLKVVGFAGLDPFLNSAFNFFSKSKVSSPPIPPTLSTPPPPRAPVASPTPSSSSPSIPPPPSNLIDNANLNVAKDKKEFSAINKKAMEIPLSPSQVPSSTPPVSPTPSSPRSRAGRMTPSNPPTLSRSPRGLGLSPTPSSSSTPGSPTLSPMSMDTPSPDASPVLRSASKSNVAAVSALSGVPEAPVAPEAPNVSAIPIASEAPESPNPLLGRVVPFGEALEKARGKLKPKPSSPPATPVTPPPSSPAKANLQDALKSSLEQYRKFVQDEEEEEDDGNWS